MVAMLDISREFIEKNIFDARMVQFSIAPEDLEEPYVTPIIEYDFINRSPDEIQATYYPIWSKENEDWDKRARAMVDLIKNCLPSEEKYIRNMKYCLCTKLQNHDRIDLVRQINNATHSFEKQKEIEINRQTLKRSVMERYDSKE
jgi:hypothetical protein